MSYASSSTQQPAAICALKSPADAIHILEAVRIGLVPRVTRRLTGQERSMIRPGTVWVWEEEETNMRRWTDGRRWGASRVGGGGFLVYTETNENMSPPTSHDMYGDYRRPSKEPLIKQTYSTSMTDPQTGKQKKFHVVAYSSKHNPQGDAHNPLPLPHQLPLLAPIQVMSGIWPEWEHRREDVAAGSASTSSSSSRRSYPPTTTTTHQPPVRSPTYDQFPRDRYHPYHDSSRTSRSPYQPHPVAPTYASSSSTPVPYAPEPDYGAYRYDQPIPRDPAAPVVGPGGPYEAYERRKSLSPQRQWSLQQQQQQQAPPPQSGPPHHSRHHDANLVPNPQAHPAAPASNGANGAAAASGGSGRSPKMSIASSLLNHEVTLPPLRLAVDGTEGDAGQPGRQPSEGSEGSGASGEGSAGGRGEDARQLGELEKRMSL